MQRFEAVHNFCNIPFKRVASKFPAPSNISPNRTFSVYFPLSPHKMLYKYPLLGPSFLTSISTIPLCVLPACHSVLSSLMETVNKLVSDRPVAVFSKNTCCMSHSIKTLLCDFGVNPTVYELDELPRGKEIEQALLHIGCNPAVPAVFIGGELVGGANEVMSLHLKRNLIPMLRRAGALWV